LKPSMSLSPPPVVLLVEDDPAVRAALAFALETRNFTVVLAVNAAHALAQDVESAAALILDQNLPDVQGLELLSLLRQQGVAGPAALITTHPPTDLENRARAAGVPIFDKTRLHDGLFAWLADVVRP